MIYNVTLCRQLIFEDTVSADSEEEALKLKDRMAAADDFTAELSIGNCGKEACQGCAFHDRCHRTEKEEA